MTTPFHLLFVKVEYDTEYTGGDYNGTGQFVLIPAVMVDRYGVKPAFHNVTGLAQCNIIHYSEDELYDAQGNHVEEWSEMFPGNTRRANRILAQVRAGHVVKIGVAKVWKHGKNLFVSVFEGVPSDRYDDSLGGILCIMEAVGERV